LGSVRRIDGYMVNPFEVKQLFFTLREGRPGSIVSSATA
jgi:hypothetical protein